MPIQTLSADVAVIGAGPAGVAAACGAAEAGASVLLLDEGLAPGGQIYRHRPGAPVPVPFRGWLARLRANEGRGMVVSSRTSVFDAVVEGDGGFRLAAVRRREDGGEETVIARARRLVLAPGARELFLPFPGWTLPGVLGVGGAQAMVKSGLEVAGRRAVVAGSGPLLLPVAAALARAGARVLEVCEQAPRPALARFALGLAGEPGKLRQGLACRLAFAPAPYRAGSWVAAAHGEGRVEAATIAGGRRPREVACDLLAVSYGLVPAVELPRLLGCRVERGAVAVGPRQETSVPGIFAAGEPCGVAGADAAIAQGEIAGLAAAGAFAPASARGRRLLADRGSARRFAARLARAFALRPELRALPAPSTVVCRCEDVACGILDPAWGARQAKLAARAGMGACQGRICGPALSFLFGWDADTNSVRAPLQPVAFEHLLAEEEPR